MPLGTLVLIFACLKCTFSVVEQFYPQENFCNNKEVIKVKIVEDGTIDNLTIKPHPPRRPRPKHKYQIFEFMVLDVFKTSSTIIPPIIKETYWYGMTRKRHMADSDGVDIYPTEYIFYFDDWKHIVVTSASMQWRLTSMFQRNALKSGKYDCTCQLDLCLDRLGQKVGYVGCELNVSSLLCSRDYNGKCTWKGAKKTCINPYNETRNKFKKRRKHKL